MNRPKDTDRSFIVKWKGNVPTIEASNWAPGYTPGHQETPQGAISMEIVELVQHIENFREKWLAINLLAETYNGANLTVTETDDFNETLFGDDLIEAVPVEVTYDNGPQDN